VIKNVGSEEARLNWRDTLDAANHGDVVVIERYGKAAAVMVSPKDWERMKNAAGLLEADRQLAEVRAGNYVTQEELDAMVIAHADSL